MADINHCADGLHQCPEGFRCRMTKTSYTCDCPRGETEIIDEKGQHKCIGKSFILMPGPFVYINGLCCKSMWFWQSAYTFIFFNKNIWISEGWIWNFLLQYPTIQCFTRLVLGSKPYFLYAFHLWWNPLSIEISYITLMQMKPKIYYHITSINATSVFNSMN